MKFLCIAYLVVTSAISEVQPEKQDNDVPDCGVACVYAACQTLGKKFSIEEIEAAFRESSPEVDLSQLSLFELRMAFESLGMHAVSVSLGVESLEEMTMPMILFFRPTRIDTKETDVGHFVLLTNVSHGFAEIVDLNISYSKMKLSLQELTTVWDGECLMVSDEPISSWRLQAGGLLGLLSAILALLLFVATLVLRFR